ncbi:indole-3-acetate O-methyltransferase 1 [Nymphaea colorata]|nr:indole-3-acetate O-methyltransferase 1 [Nymphaea colorata]
MAMTMHVKLERLLSMKGGKGDSSYAKNSQAQAEHARSVLYLLEAALDEMQLTATDSAFTVVDLGCSSGNNTLFVVDRIVKHMLKRYESAGAPVPEFQAFFSDLPSNDFNTLFQLMPSLVKNASLEQCLTAVDHIQRSYFAAAVPGSFYGRLFPAKSVDVFHSAFSLHWLSQVPEAVTERWSAAYNRGKIFIHGASEATANAYRRQFQQDLAGFLRWRSQEMKSGGCMFLVCLGRTSTVPSDQGGAGLLFGTHFEDAWNDLVVEGLVDAEKRDSFNVPVYAPNLEDFQEVVEANGCFVVNKLEVFKGGSPLVVSCPDDAAEIGRALANSCRTVCGVLVEAHIGEPLSHELFARLERRATLHAKELLDQLQLFHVVASLSLA